MTKTDHAFPVPDALTLLQQDQASVAALLDAYQTLCDREQATFAEKHALTHRLHLELTLCTMPQQEILAPPMRAVLRNPTLFREQDVTAWSLIAHVSMGEPGDSRFDLRLLALGSELVRHWAQERREVLPHVRTSGLDLVALGARMRARRESLMVEFDPMAHVKDEDEAEDPVGRPVSAALRGEG